MSGSWRAATRKDREPAPNDASSICLMRSPTQAPDSLKLDGSLSNGPLCDATQCMDANSNTDGAALLDSQATFLRRYVFMATEQLDVLAPWNVHTYLIDRLSVTPYAHIHSPERGCGKTLLLEVEALLCARSLFSSGMSTAALVRSLGDKPTLFLDEMDAAFGGDKERASTLRGVLNSGYKSSGVYRLCVGEGSKIRVVALPTFGAKMLAGIGRKSVPDTVRDRSISFDQQKISPDEEVEPFFEEEAKLTAAPLREATVQWTDANADVIMARIKELYLHRRDDRILSQLQPRQFQIWVVLVAICDVAGADWPQRIRTAVTELALGEDAEDRSHRERLLANIYEVFEDTDREPNAGATPDRVDFISSIDLAHRLKANDDWEWADWNSRDKDKGIKPRQIAALLREFGVRPKTLREAHHTFKGYRREWFDKVWRRYRIPAEPTPDPSHPSQLGSDAGSTLVFNRSQDLGVTDGDVNSSYDGIEDVTDVTDAPGGNGRAVVHPQQSELAASAQYWEDRLEADPGLDTPDYHEEPF